MIHDAAAIAAAETSSAHIQSERACEPMDTPRTVHRSPCVGLEAAASPRGIPQVRLYPLQVKPYPPGTLAAKRKPYGFRA